MTDYQRRWMCRECKREWVEPTYHFVNSAPCSITGNPKGVNCPVCGSPEIQEVLFKPYFPGLDIDRENASSFTVLPKNPVITSVPSLTNDQTLNIKADPLEFPPPISQEEPTIEDQIAAVKVTIESNPIYDLSDMD